MCHSNTIDSEASRLSTDIESFIGTSAADSFKNRAVVSTARCTGDVLRDLSALQRLEIQLNCLVQLSGQSSLETDNIGDEKEKVLKRIEADKKPPNNIKNTKATGYTSRPIGKPVSEGVDIKLCKHIEQKKHEMADCEESIVQTRQASEKLAEDIRLAQREKDLVLSKKQKEVDELRQTVELKDSENDQLSQCLEALKKELSAVSNELGRFSNRSSRLEQGRRVNNIISSSIAENDRGMSSGKSSRAASSNSQLPRINETQRRSLSGTYKKLA